MIQRLKFKQAKMSILSNQWKNFFGYRMTVFRTIDFITVPRQQ